MRSEHLVKVRLGCQPHKLKELVEPIQANEVDNQSRERRLEFGRRAVCKPVALLKRVVSLNAVADCCHGRRLRATSYATVAATSGQV